MTLPNIKQITLETYDNPGWGITVHYQEAISSEKRSLIDYDNSEDDWLFYTVEKNTLRLRGDKTKLVTLVKYLFDLMEMDAREHTRLLKNLYWLSLWYSTQCDGDWEHTHTIRATITSQGHCHCTIDLENTWGYLEEQIFESVGNIATFWCQKEGNQFIGEGQVAHLNTYLEAFRDWVEGCLVGLI